MGTPAKLDIFGSDERNPRKDIASMR